MPGVQRPVAESVNRSPGLRLILVLVHPALAGTVTSTLVAGEVVVCCRACQREVAGTPGIKVARGEGEEPTADWAFAVPGRPGDTALTVGKVTTSSIASRRYFKLGLIYAPRLLKSGEA
jgi:hypothetical protein